MKRLALVALAVFTLAACTLSGSGASSSGNGHKCADLVARATTTTAPVLGLWNCLTPALQGKLKPTGSTNVPDDALSVGIAITERFLGANADFATYELELNPGTAQLAGVKRVVLTVWLDPAGSGKVENVGVPAPAF